MSWRTARSVCRRAASCSRSILPDTLTPLIVAGTLGIATAILDAAALSFLGLGAQPPMAEWGSMMGAERNQIFTSPHLVFFPGLAIMLTVLALQPARRRTARCAGSEAETIARYLAWSQTC